MKKGNGKYTAEIMIQALKETKGMVHLAAKKIGCSPTTVYTYAKRYPTVQAEIDNQRGEFLDITELALARAVQAGEGWAVCFTLKTIGKKRGYVEKQEIEQTTTHKFDGDPLDKLISRLDSIATAEQERDDTERSDTE